MTTRFITRIELTPHTRRSLTELTEANGMTQVAVLSRLVEWFAKQPEGVQAMILGRIPVQYEHDVAIMVLENLRKRSDL